MIIRLVPEISPFDAFCDAGVVVVVGIVDSRSWISANPLFKGGEGVSVIVCQAIVNLVAFWQIVQL